MDDRWRGHAPGLTPWRWTNLKMQRRRAPPSLRETASGLDDQQIAEAPWVTRPRVMVPVVGRSGIRQACTAW